MTENTLGRTMTERNPIILNVVNFEAWGFKYSVFLVPDVYFMVAFPTLILNHMYYIYDRDKLSYSAATKEKKLKPSNIWILKKKHHGGTMIQDLAYCPTIRLIHLSTTSSYICVCVCVWGRILPTVGLTLLYINLIF